MIEINLIHFSDLLWYGWKYNSLIYFVSLAISFKNLLVFISFLWAHPLFMSIKSLFHFRFDINLIHIDVFSQQIICLDTDEKDAKYLVKILCRTKTVKASLRMYRSRYHKNRFQSTIYFNKAWNVLYFLNVWLKWISISLSKTINSYYSIIVYKSLITKFGK